MKMNRPLRRHLLGSLAVCGLLLSSSGGAAASVWTPSARKKMVVDALEVVPPTLARLIRQHPAALLAGLADAALEGEGEQHRQESDQATGGAAASLAVTARWAADAVESRRPMADLVYRLGVVAHYAADLSDPTLTHPRGATAAFVEDYGRYVERNLIRYPVVFYGYPDLESLLEAGREDRDARPGRRLHADALAQARHARAYYEHLERAYASSGGRSEPFDERSIPFGIGSLAYSRAVTGIARAWLHAWTAARGDISGTPYLKGAPPLPPSLEGAFREGAVNPPLLRWSQAPGVETGAAPGKRPAWEGAGATEPIQKKINGKERTKSEGDAREN